MQAAPLSSSSSIIRRSLSSVCETSREYLPNEPSFFLVIFFGKQQRPVWFSTMTVPFWYFLTTANKGVTFTNVCPENVKSPVLFDSKYLSSGSFFFSFSFCNFLQHIFQHCWIVLHDTVHQRYIRYIYFTFLMGGCVFWHFNIFNWPFTRNIWTL